MNLNTIIKSTIQKLLHSINFLKSVRGVIKAVSDSNDIATVELVGDESSTVTIPNKTNEYLQIGDNVVVYYWTKLTSGYVGLKLGKSTNRSGNFDSNVIVNSDEHQLINYSEQVGRLNNDKVYVGNNTNDIILSSGLIIRNHSKEGYQIKPDYNSKSFKFKYGNSDCEIKWYVESTVSGWFSEYKNAGSVFVELIVPDDAYWGRMITANGYHDDMGYSGERIDTYVNTTDISSIGFTFNFDGNIYPFYNESGELSYGLKSNMSFEDSRSDIPNTGGFITMSYSEKEDTIENKGGHIGDTNYLLIDFIPKSQNNIKDKLFVLSDDDYNMARSFLGVN